LIGSNWKKFHVSDSPFHERVIPFLPNEKAPSAVMVVNIVKMMALSRMTTMSSVMMITKMMVVMPSTLMMVAMSMMKAVVLVMMMIH